MSFNSIAVDSIVPRHGSKVSITGLDMTQTVFTSALIQTSTIVSSTTYGGTITQCAIMDCDITLVSTTTAYLIPSTEIYYEDGGQQSHAIADCYCHVTTAVLEPFVLIGTSGLVDVNGDAYSAPVGAVLVTGTSVTLATMPPGFRPLADCKWPVSINQTTAAVGMLALASTSGKLEITTLTPAGELVLYPFCGKYMT